MGYNNLLINGVYWGYNPLTNHLLTSWDIQVGCLSPTGFWNMFRLKDPKLHLSRLWHPERGSFWHPKLYPWIYPPPRMPVANEGWVRDSLLKMVHNPGGDWHPGWGVDLSYTPLEFNRSPLKSYKPNRKADRLPFPTIFQVFFSLLNFRGVFQYEISVLFEVMEKKLSHKDCQIVLKINDGELSNEKRDPMWLECPPENQHVPQKSRLFEKDMSSSNHWFSGDMIVFGGSI